jgi:DNA-binding CsgD family transcriptional regulator
MPCQEEPCVARIVEMDVSRVSRLSDGQRECLKRVLVHKNSKEIAIELGISPHTVDQRLRAAIKILDVSNRFEAARLLAASEPLVQYQQPVYQTLDIEREMRFQQTDQVEERPEIVSTLKEEAISENLNDETDAISNSQYRLFDQIRNFREPPESRIVYRVAIIIGLSIMIAMAFGMFLAGFEALERLAAANI